MHISTARAAVAATLGMALGTVGARQQSAEAQTLILNGKTASTSVRVIGGSAYVKLSDMAKALNMIVVKRPGGGYEITPAGGANQIKGVTQGKIGDVLFDGKWRFQVESAETPDSYTLKTEAEPYDYSGLSTFDRPKRLVRPRAGNILVVLQCRVTNGVKEKRTLWTSISDERIRTALTDRDGSSHAPIIYDFDGGPIQSKWLTPGGTLRFALLFSVPQGTVLKDLIFTLKNNQTDDKGNDVRVALTP